MTRGPLDLLGTWAFDREIDDRHTGIPAVVVGELRLAAEPDGRVSWHESGTMTRDGTQVPVTRTLFLQSRDDGWMVTFDHGGDFHPWRPGESVDHPCGRDLYCGVVDTDGSGDWAVVWEVSGPSKDYTMVTRLRSHR